MARGGHAGEVSNQGSAHPRHSGTRHAFTIYIANWAGQDYSQFLRAAGSN
jgi:hypothetical protein